MPEGYTHAKMAAKAAAAAQLQLSDVRAYTLGANGPDPFFFYQVWMPKKFVKYDFHALGNQMHSHKTGAFLQSLLTHAKTQVQWEYALGFLCHYGVDSIMHPYVEAVQQPGSPYCRKAGHGFFEIGLDSYLYQQDYGFGGIPAEASTPTIAKGKMMQIAGLLKICIREVYGVEYPVGEIIRSFDHMRLVRKVLSNPGPMLKRILTIADKLMGEGFVLSHVTPAPLDGLDNLPKLPGRPWHNPCSGEDIEGDLFTNLETSVGQCAKLVRAASLYKQGQLTWPQLCSVIGSLSYETGLTVE